MQKNVLTPRTFSQSNDGAKEDENTNGRTHQTREAHRVHAGRAVHHQPACCLCGENPFSSPVLHFPILLIRNISTFRHYPCDRKLKNRKLRRHENTNPKKTDCLHRNCNHNAVLHNACRVRGKNTAAKLFSVRPKAGRVGRSLRPVDSWQRRYCAGCQRQRRR